VRSLNAARGSVSWVVSAVTANRSTLATGPSGPASAASA
jgi:hypothetical protein